jgi:hypothetical protein
MEDIRAICERLVALWDADETDPEAP